MTVSATNTFSNYLSIHIGDTIQFKHKQNTLIGVIVVSNNKLAIQVVKCFKAPDNYLFKVFHIDSVTNIEVLHRNTYTRNF